MLPRWSASRLLRKVRAATAICRLLREARGTSPPVHGPVVVRGSDPDEVKGTPPVMNRRWIVLPAPRLNRTRWTIRRACESLVDQPRPMSVFSAHQATGLRVRSEEHTSELQSRRDLVCRLLLEK